MNAGQTYKSKTNVLDVYDYLPCFFIAFRFLLLLIRSLYQEGTLHCLLIRRFAAPFHSKHFAQIKPALFSKDIYNIYILHVIRIFRLFIHFRLFTVLLLLIHYLQGSVPLVVTVLCNTYYYAILYIIIILYSLIYTSYQ